MLKKLPLSSLLILIIVGVGFLYRYYGIKDNHSFWADEAYISYIARTITQGIRTVPQGVHLAVYQPAYMLMLSILFKLFGATEFVARLPSVLMGTVGIVFAYLVAKKFSNIIGGFIASFLYAFSQLNLTNATQAKSYSIIQTLVLMSFYFISLLEEKKYSRVWLHAAIILCNSLATTLHFIGVLGWITYITYLLLEHRKTLFSQLKKPVYILSFIVFLGVAVYIFQLGNMIRWFVVAGKGNIFFTFNHVTYVRELLWRNYAFITLPAVFGMIMAARGSKRWLQYSIIAFMLVSLYLWSFKHYTHNIRYMVPFFGVLFVYFGVFWGKIIEQMNSKYSWVMAAILIFLIYGGGYKIVRKPALYYNPNEDLLADVQGANYKDAFTQLVTKYPQTKNYVIYNNVVDAQPWYLNNRLPDGIFMKYDQVGLAYGATTTHIATGVTVYTTAAQLDQLTKKHPRGVLIVEDWPSYLPEEIKDYARQNLKLEIEVKSLPHAPTDPWPIKIYSWGM